MSAQAVHETSVGMNTLAAITLAAICICCASGLMAAEFASSSTSWLSTWFFSLKAATRPCLAVLFTVAPASHLAGCATLSKSGYRAWQPFRGGGHFVVAQATGWAFWSAGLTLAVVDVLCKLFTSHANNCFTCAPIALVIVVLAGNTALLASLLLFASSAPVRSKQRKLTCAVALSMALFAPPVLQSEMFCMALIYVREWLRKNTSLTAGLLLIGALNRYPMQVPPSVALDFFGVRDANGWNTQHLSASVRPTHMKV